MPSLILPLLLLTSSQPVADLPFELVNNRVYLKATAKGEPITAIVDTGAAMSAIDLELAERLGSESYREVQASGVGASRQRALLLKDFEIGIDGTLLKHNVPVAISFKDLSPLEGQPLQAILGYEFLVNYVVEIDYENQRFRLHSSENFLAPNVTPLPIRFQSNHPHVEGYVTIPGVGQTAVGVLLDTGASSAITFTGRYLNKNSLLERYGDLPSIVTGAGVGGPTKGKRVRIASLQLGTAVLNAPVANFTVSAGGVLGDDATFDALVGAEVLRRFKVTFDYPGKRLYLEPNSGYTSPFVGDRTGLFLMADGPDFRDFKVYALVPGSPAAVAGMKEGDQILEINGKPPITFTLNSLRRFLRETKETVRLKIRRGSQQFFVTFAPREIW